MRNVYYLVDDLSATPRGVVTVRIDPRPHSAATPTIIIAWPPSLVASEPLSTHPLALGLMDRWLTTKMIVIGVTARKERKSGLTPDLTSRGASKE